MSAQPVPLSEPEPVGFEPSAADRAAWEARQGDDADAPAGVDPLPPLRIQTLDEFVSVNEEGSEPIVGAAGDVLIPENGDVMLYGDGGVGKTTLALDLACHLAAGDDWLGISIPRPCRVLVVENEGPRPLFREKLRAKRDAWQGSPIEDRLLLLEEPWAQFTFADEGQRDALAGACRELEVDVVVIGPIAASGMNDAGTLQEVRAFGRLLDDVRVRAMRRLAFLLVHHENKGGSVSGAWEGCGDTLLHMQGQGNGRARLVMQKVRWASELHGRTLQLVWAEGAAFQLEDADAKAVRKAAEVDEALAWIVSYVAANPRLARGKVEEAYAAATGSKGARARAREAINREIQKAENPELDTASPPLLATTVGESPGGRYLIPFADADSPLAGTLFGEPGGQASDPAAGGDSPTRRSPKGAAGMAASSADGVGEDDSGNDDIPLTAASEEPS